MQSGKLYNMESERKVRPRLFSIPENSNRELDNGPVDMQDTDPDNDNVGFIPENISLDNMIDDLSLGNQQPSGYPEAAAIRPGNRHLSHDVSFQERHRRALHKFEPLNVGGRALTGISIGGFDIDLTAAAQKAREVIPLPSSKLPVIFLDEELNFYHHFFQGLNYILGKASVMQIVTCNVYDNDAGERILSLITEMLESGYERGDSEIVIFVKKVITSTFELSNSATKKYTSDRIFVVANLWGFQYIEPGMQCDQATVVMWLSMCYGHYKTIWFNTFKLTGVPDFSYRSSTQVEKDRAITPMHFDELDSNSFHENKVKHGRSNRSPSRTFDNQSITSKRHKRPNRRDSQITRWIASN